MMRRFLSVDPGYAACGWVLWHFELNRTGKWSIEQAGVMHSDTKAKNTSYFRTNVMIDGLQDRLGYTPLECLVCEEMQIMGGAGGYASSRTTILPLCAAVGQWARWIHSKGGRFVPAPVSEWKGQLPKDVVNDRVKKLLSRKDLEALSPDRSHDWDAAGIGLWYLGRFK